MVADEILMQLILRYPPLAVCEADISHTFEIMKSAYICGKKLLVAGNGGSASDSEHIIGELMKSFRFRRPIPAGYASSLKKLFGHEGSVLAGKLEGALPAIALPSMTALMTAYMNDNEADAVFAQMVFGCGSEGDVLLAISTSGNSPNILNACMVAKAKGMKIIGLTGRSGGKMKILCDTAICVPETETYAIQEYHLPVYHTLCAMLETAFFGAFPEGNE